MSASTQFALRKVSSYSITITNCNFTDNSYNLGNGAAININNFPGKITIQNSYFGGNSAINGGAIASASTVVKISTSKFVKNRALNGGGAIYWTYNSNYKVVVGSGCTSIGNNASYGDFTATDLVRLNVSTAYPGVAQVSGQSLKSPLLVSLLDYYNQVVKTQTVNVLASIYNSTSSTLKGSSIVSSISGVASFSNVVVTGYPGRITQLQFSSSLTGVPPTIYNLYFRDCISGEVTLYADAEHASAACELCTIGTYSYFPSDSECSLCPQNAYCPGGNVVDMNANYWRSYQESSVILQCPSYGVCLGGANTSTQCRTGTKGAYCSICDDGYVRSQSGECYQCSDSASIASQMASTICLFFICFVGYLMYRNRDKLAAFYNRRLSKKVATFLVSPRYRFIRVKFKIVIAFFQIIFSIGPALNIVFPANFSYFVGYYSIFQLNLIYVPDFNCAFQTNYYSDLIFTTMSPIAEFVCIVVALRLVVIQAQRLNSRRPFYTSRMAMKHTIMTAFLLSYFVLVNVSVTIFRVFQCQAFDNGDLLLVADYSIDCRASNRAFYLTFAVVMMVIYPIGIPLVYAVILYRNREKINPPSHLVVDKNEADVVNEDIIQAAKIKVRSSYKSLEKIRNLFDSCTPKRWYFEVLDCVRRLLLGAIPVLIARGTFMQIVFVLVVSLFSVAMLMEFKPYIYTSDNQASEFLVTHFCNYKMIENLLLGCGDGSMGNNLCSTRLHDPQC